MKILLAIDNSIYSQAAVNEVMTRPWPANSVIRVITVVANILLPATEVWYGAAPSLELAEQTRQQLLKNAQEFLNQVSSSLQATGLLIETLVLEGDPRGSIVDEAESWDADIIVVGSHGYTGLKRMLLGSVAHSVVSHAPCSVEVVRSKKHSA